MRVRETFYRGAELVRMPSAMPARTYNLTRILLARSRDSFVFVPIRSMQYLAIVEANEFNFLHAEARPNIEISWQDFASSGRASLEDPVPYTAVHHAAGAAVTMVRLQAEFLRAMQLAAARSAPADTGVVLELKRR
jgi:hypothetical protein